MIWQRPDGRDHDRIRPVRFEFDISTAPASSVLAYSGETKVLCCATIEPGVPRFLEGSGQGWLTAEYRMLPGSTSRRHPREFLKLSGRTQEIQRLIGRSLRAALNLKALGERTIYIDADVLQADAGTRTTSIVGGWVALTDAINRLITTGELDTSPITHAIAAVSVGMIEDDAFLDLNYTEDVAASVDFNVVMNDQLDLIEVQGTAEDQSFSRSQLDDMLNLAELGIRDLFTAQSEALAQRYWNT
jgi:ribonuclease PH